MLAGMPVIMIIVLYAKDGGSGLDSQWLPCFFFSLLAGLLNVDGMKDLWCSSTLIE